MFTFFFSKLIPLAHASEVSPIGPTGSTSTAPTGTLVNLINIMGGNLLAIITLIAGILAVFYLIWSGIQYITSAGSADKVKVARAGIINAVIGIVVIVVAFAVIRFAISIGSDVTKGV